MNNYENLIGTKLDNRYEIISIVGIGGMAVVYEAADIDMNRRVAVKMLKSDIQDDTQDIKRFINESKIVAMLSHPNIVQIYDVSVKNPENMYIVMEYIDGITLKDYINGKGRLQWREAIVYAEQILTALQHAHEKGIIHRDIKPQNIILLRNGNIKVTDFGIAKLPNSEPLTMTDKAIGTAHYMSPEQAGGDGRITTISDIYSVGVMLYEMATGKLPFTGNTAFQVAVMQVNDTPQDPRELVREIPKGLSQIILKAMSKQPESRYRSAEAMMKNLSLLASNPAAVFSDNRQKLPVPVEKNGKAVVKSEEKSADVIKKNNPNEGDMRRRGRNKKKTIRNNRSFLPIISGVTLAFLIILGISGYNIILGLMQEVDSSGGETVTIDNYVGRFYDDSLILELENIKYDVKTEYVNNDVMSPNQIVSQLPEGGHTKKRATPDTRIPLTLTISKGKDAFALPDVSYNPGREMGVYLETLQLKVEIKEETHDSIVSGFVIRSEPVQGTVVNTGDKIILYVSSGQEIKKTLMPYLVGMTEREAQKALSENNLVLKEFRYEYHETAEKGTVTKQDITATREVPEKSTKVTLTVSLGPKPSPTTAAKTTE